MAVSLLQDPVQLGIITLLSLNHEAGSRPSFPSKVQSAFRYKAEVRKSKRGSSKQKSQTDRQTETERQTETDRETETDRQRQRLRDRDRQIDR